MYTVAWGRGTCRESPTHVTKPHSHTTVDAEKTAQWQDHSSPLLKYWWIFSMFKGWEWFLRINNERSYKVQAHLILLHLVYCTWQLLCFLQTEGLQQPFIKLVYWCHFSSGLLCISVSHLAILAILLAFSLWVYMLWSWINDYDLVKASIF